MRLGRALAALVMWVASGRAHADPGAEAVVEPAAELGWTDGAHLTGGWGGARSALGSRGVTLDMVYASDAFTARGREAVLGHVDAAITLDSRKLGCGTAGRCTPWRKTATATGSTTRSGRTSR